MAGFIGFGTALGNILSGQQQGQQQTDLYKQQIDSQKLDDQIKRRLLMDKLDEYRQQQQALSKASPEEQQFLNLGGTVENWDKRSDRTTKANGIADQLYQKSLDPSVPIEQRLQAATMSANLRGHPELVDSLPESLKISGIGEKQPAKPFHPFTTASGVSAFEGYDPATGKPRIESLGAAPAGALKLVPTRDADGHPISVWYNAKTGAPSGLPSIPGHLSAQETSGLEATRSLREDMPKLQAAANALPDTSPATLARQYMIYAHPGFGATAGLLGPVDSRYQTYFSSIGNIKAELAKLQASGSSRSMALLNFIRGHIPEETDTPQSAMQKLKTLDAGRFQSLTNAILGGSASSAPPSDAGGSDTLIGTTPDGRKVYQLPDGTKVAR